MTNKMKTGVLLMNLGTPDAADVSSVRRYLREFLLDPRVIDLPPIVRQLLVYGAILPFRPFASAKAYKEIWQEDGSPLMIHAKALQDKLATVLGEAYQVALAMRYGNPSVDKALAELSHCDHVIMIPLFPQYSSAATGSAMEHFLKAIGRGWNIPKISVIDSFYNDPGYIKAYVDLLRPYVAGDDTFLLFSYHGLPERHLDKSACTVSCDRRESCPAMQRDNHFCYRAQCYETTRLLAQELALPKERYMSSFQSRLGKIPWIKPYTDEVFTQLRDKGITNLAVACPAFVADCLETLEEIGMQGKEQWLSLGGESFRLLPCLNANDQWVAALADMVQQSSNVSVQIPQELVEKS
jgi:protoporphyrin/coproporphyrin ferrochelatase